jgi:hypothetical protein
MKMESLYTFITMVPARALVKTPQSKPPTIVEGPAIVRSGQKPPLLRRAKKQLNQWEQMLLGELLAWTLPATDYRRR